jgi:hypothetical protein
MNRSLRNHCVLSVIVFAIVILVALILTTFGGNSHAAAGAPPVAAQPGANAAPFVPRRVLVKFHEDVPDSQADEIIAELGAREIGRIDQIGVRIVQVPASGGEEDSARRFCSRPEVGYAELDYLLHADDIVPNDPLFSQQWHLPKISCPTAWSSTTGTSSVTIAIVDTGTNPVSDLGGKLVPGWDFDRNDSNTSDVYGHGTWVAGTAAAVGDNEVGVAAPAWQCLVMPIRVANQYGWAQVSNIANGIVYAADHGCRVANASFAATSYQVVSNAAQYMTGKNGVVTISAGNTGQFVSYPDNPYILTVSATDQNDQLASFTTTGNYVDLSAPGVGIVTTAMDGSYQSVSGTSFSAPLTAGVAALVMSVNPSLTGMQVQAVIKQSVDDLGPTGWDPGYGWGRLNAARAVSYALNPGNLDLTPPSVSMNFPSSGSTLTGVTLIGAAASDNVSVKAISFWLDGILIGCAGNAPYQINWNSGTVVNGAHTLMALAVDEVGNTSQASVSVTTNNGIGDTSPPVVSLAAPASGSTISGTITVLVSATDIVGVVSVTLQVDNNPVSSPDVPPAFNPNGGCPSAPSGYKFTFSTTCLTNAQHTLTARATDAAGNMGTAQIVVTAYNASDTCPPNLTVSYPANAATISGSLFIQAQATDNVAMSQVWARVDNTNIGTAIATSPYIIPWNAATLTNGLHWLYVFASDPSGNTASVTVAVYVQNPAPLPDTSPPQIIITSPYNGYVVSKTAKQLSVYVDAMDNVGVVKVELYVDGKLTATSTGSPFTTTWTVVRGQHTLQCKAYDAAGNVGISPGVLVSKQ